MLEDWPPFRSLKDIGEEDFGTEVAVVGWVEDTRNLGGIAFLIVRQREGTLQVSTRRAENEGLFQDLTQIPRESVVGFRGIVRRNPDVRNGFEIFPKDYEILGLAEKPLPLGVVDKVRAEMDTRLDNRCMDLRKPEVRAIFALRSYINAGLREYLRERGFIETHTPKVISAGAEGGATLFRVDYFGKSAYLAQSPQLYKQILMATGLDRVFEIAPAFRAEVSDTVRHTSEFISYDAEMAFIRSQEEVLKVLEGSVVHALEYVRTNAQEELEVLEAEPVVPKLPVPRLHYNEARRMLGEEGRDIPDGEDIDTESERVLGEAMRREGHPMYYIVEYPSEIKPFYIMVNDEEPEYSLSFDLDYLGDEMASGGQREHRPDRLIQRLREKGLDPEDFEFYVKAFRYGMPPHGGWGFGLDRLVAKVAGLSNIREGILFPRDRQRLTP